MATLTLDSLKAQRRGPAQNRETGILGPHSKPKPERKDEMVHQEKRKEVERKELEKTLSAEINAT
jgi:hypothetical protein